MSGPDLMQIAPQLYRLRIPGDRAHLLNCYLWVGETEVTLVDTGWPDSADLISSALRAVGKQCRDVGRVVLTHFHEDHAGSAAEIAGWSSVEVIAGAADAVWVEGSERGPLPALTVSEQAIHPGFNEPPHAPPCRVDRVVRHGDTIDFAGGARVLDVAGHTPGSIALYLPEVNAVLTGDAVAEFNGDVILGVFNVDRQSAAEALSTMAATGAQIAGFGHGEAILSDAAARIGSAVDAFA